MPENNSTDIRFDAAGNSAVYFAPDVLATIAGIALTEIEGIASSVKYSALAGERRGKRPVNNIKNITRGIKVEVKDALVSVSVTIMVEYGYAVPEVCRSIQEGIKKNIETMTGMTVSNVDVHVTGLSFAKENREAAELEYRSYLLGQKEEPAASDDAHASDGKGGAEE